ncbi:MAG: Gfo/Idh/MocA family oxidoreductase, partial [Candidatus Omnitrophica bacterium]|nr:Gfo/Idh/MocA family oxidoreductase [Candidatus Omnitrophota bacterium]
MNSPTNPLKRSSSRREFLQTTGAAAAALSIPASSWARVAGANDRLRIGLVGCGNRGIEAHMSQVHDHSKDQNAEVVAVCDPWRVHREEAVAKAKEWFGIDVAQYVSYRDLLEKEDLDAVMIASCDHQHTAHLEAFAKAGKDVYCEKPLAMDLEKLKSACDAVKESGGVVQIGTQLRSLPSMTGAKALYATGALGT